MFKIILINRSYCHLWITKTHKTMKALVYHGAGKKSWEEKPKPSILLPTDAIVKILKTTICGTDLHIMKGDVPEVTDGRAIHGHTYHLTIYAEGGLIPHEGWVFDFGDLTKIMTPVIAILDHHLLNEIAGLQNLTAELLAIWIWERGNNTNQVACSKSTFYLYLPLGVT